MGGVAVHDLPLGIGQGLGEVRARSDEAQDEGRHAGDSTPADGHPGAHVTRAPLEVTGAERDSRRLRYGAGPPLSSSCRFRSCGRPAEQASERRCYVAVALVRLADARVAKPLVPRCQLSALNLCFAAPRQMLMPRADEGTASPPLAPGASTHRRRRMRTVFGVRFVGGGVASGSASSLPIRSGTGRLPRGRRPRPRAARCRVGAARREPGTPCPAQSSPTDSKRRPLPGDEQPARGDEFAQLPDQDRLEIDFPLGCFPIGAFEHRL